MRKRNQADRPTTFDPRPTRRRTRYLPALDRMEGRLLLSTVVTNDHDSGLGSLRAALVSEPS
jgi:hypothetical protein